MTEKELQASSYQLQACSVLSPPAKVMILAKIVSTCRFSKMVLAQIISTVDVSILENGTRYDHSRLKKSCKLQAISCKLVQYYHLRRKL
ncbi:hypothetical protein DXN05_09325 [Deminuibacter soli]|uniref:Uncharacterized protein n=1 Tax=Deminuibacter soli TaxID=2291815 RepID=A0A3E1NLZ6_9BACT|nr:hypothetical protein DXN05_09325 [Deminuibacter soli]